MADNIPATETFNPARAAVQVGIPPSTLRLWAKVYAEFLSPGSNPEPGQERRFTASDVEILRAVAQLRANGLQPPDIIARLHANPAEPLQNVTESAVTGLERVQGTDTPHGPASAQIAAFLARTDALDKLTDIDRRLERVESQRSLVLVAIAAFAGGAVTIAMIVWLLSMLR